MAYNAGSVLVPVVPSMGGFSSKIAAQSSLAGATGGKAFGATFAKAVAIGAAATAAAGAVAVKQLYDVGSEIDKSFDTIRVGTGATGKALKGLENDFRAVAKSAPSTFEETSKTVADLNTRLGLSGKPLRSLSTQVLNLSRITKTDLGGNIREVSRVLGDWSVKTKDQSSRLDGLYRVSQATGITVKDLSASMVQFGSPMRQLGFDMGETAAMFGRFEQEGVNASTLMPGFKQAVSNMARPTDSLKKSFDKAGISLDKGFKVGLEQTFEALKGMKDPMKASALAADVFGTRAGPDMAAAIKEGRFELEDLEKTFNSGKETINKASKNTMSFSESWTLFKNNLKLYVEPVATRVFQGLSNGMRWLAKNAVPFFKRISDGAKGIYNLLVKGDFTGKLARAFGIFEDNAIIVGILNIRKSLLNLGASGAGVSDRMAEMKRTVVSVFSSLVRAVTPIVKDYIAFIRDNWPLIKQTIVSTMKTAASAVKSGTEFIRVLFRKVADVVTFIWDRWGDRILSIVKTLFETVWSVLKGAFKIIRGIFDTATAILRGDWKGAWAGIKTILSGAWDVIIAIVRGGFKVLREVFAIAWDVLKSGTKVAWSGFKSIISDTWSGVKSILSGVGGFLKDKVVGAFQTAVGAIGKVWDKLKSIAIKPINFLIGTVYNDGIRVLLNKVAGLIPGAGSLDKMGLLGSGGGDYSGQTSPAAFARGGHTGPGGKYDPAGIVHAREFVVRSESTGDIERKAPGFLDRLNKDGSKAFHAYPPPHMPGYWLGGGVLPLPGAAVIKKHKTPYYGAWYAADFNGPGEDTGDRIAAWKAGRVARAAMNGQDGSYGNVVDINHPDGNMTRYAHQSFIRVRGGQEVKAGRTVGGVGATGNVTGPHLHFEIKGGKASIVPGGGGGKMGGSQMTSQASAAQAGLDKLADKIRERLSDGLPKRLGDPVAAGIDKISEAVGKVTTSTYEGAKGATGTWAPVVKAVLAEIGESESLAGVVLARINQESGGKLNAVNNWDSNAAAGYPSTGLMQVIRPTFQAFAGKYKNTQPMLNGVSIDPFANIYAALRYARSRYGNIQGPMTQPGGYDNGGVASGRGFLPKYTPEPERVLSPNQTRSYDRHVAVLERIDRRAGSQPLQVSGKLTITNWKTGESRFEAIADDRIDQAGAHDRTLARMR